MVTMFDHICSDEANFCRLCLTKTVTLQNIKNLCDSTPPFTTLTAKVLYCLDMDLEKYPVQNDPVICGSCLENVLTFFHFKVTCKKADTQLKAIFNTPQNQDDIAEPLREKISVRKGQKLKKQISNKLKKINIVANKTESLENSLEDDMNHSQTAEVLIKDDEDLSSTAEQKYTSDNLKQPKTVLPNSTFCAICQENLKETEPLSEHNRHHHGIEKNGFRCFACPKLFRNSPYRKYHEERHCKHLMQGYECTECKRFLPTREMYEEHSRNHRKNLDISLPVDLFTCSHCNGTFKTKFDLQTHKLIHKDEIPFKQNTFKTLELKSKQRNMNNTKTIELKCFGCEKTFECRKRRYHHETHCAALQNGYACALCDTKLPSRKLYNMHERRHRIYNDKSLIEQSFKTFISRSTRPNIYKSNNDRKVNQVFKCFGCELTFKSSQRRHHHEKNSCLALKDGYKCGLCGDTLPSRKQYDVHERKHWSRQCSNDDTRCMSCDVAFKTRLELVQHNRTHVKKFICEVCGRIFKYKAHLQSHMVTHTRVKPLACSHCSFRTAHLAALTYHLRRHTGEKPYQCDMCPQRCASSGNLAAHKLTHAGVKRFECTLCSNKFARKSSLTYHMAYVHEDLRLNPCDTCGATYARPNGLQRHIKKKHSQVGAESDAGIVNEASQL